MSAAADDLDDFGSFTAAERLSDPYADVYGLPAEQPAASPAPAAVATATSGSPSLLSFSPVLGPEAALTVSPRSLADPFADILAGASSAAPLAATAASSATDQTSLLSFSPLLSAGGDRSAIAAPSTTGLLLPPPRSSASSSPAPPPAVSDLLSFSPLAADSSVAAPFADVFGGGDASDSGAFDDPFAAVGERATNSFSGASPVSAFGLDSLTDAKPHIPASAPASLHSSFQHPVASLAAPDDAADDWTDFVAADDAVSGPLAEPGSSGILTASPVHFEAALDDSSSSIGAFELPSPQSLGIEGATSSASAELNPDIYFFSQDSTGSAGAKGEGTADNHDVFSSSFDGHEALLTDPGSRGGGMELDPVVSIGGGAYSSGVDEQEADLWGPLSPPFSSPSPPLDVEDNALARSSDSGAPGGLRLADVSALDPFSFAGASASTPDAPASNDSSGDYYNLLVGTTATSSTPIEFPTATAGDEDEFGDFSAGQDAFERHPSASSSEEAAADSFGDLAPPPATTVSLSDDDDADVFDQQPASTAVDGGMDQVQAAADSFEESKSELAISPHGWIGESMDSIDSGHAGDVDVSSPVASVSPGNGANATGDSVHGPSSPGHGDGAQEVEGFVGSEDVPEVASRDDSDDFGVFARSPSASATEENPTSSTFGEFGDFAHSPGVSDGGNRAGDDNEFGSFAHSTGFSSSAHTNVGEDDSANDDFGDFADSSAFTTSATATASANDDDDAFGDFAQSSAPSADDKDDDFGNFADSSAFNNGGDDDFGDFAASSAPAPSSGADDDAFGDFSSPPASVGASQGEAVASDVSFADDRDLAAFFAEAFADVSVSVTIDASAGSSDDKFTSSYVVDSAATSMTPGMVASIVNAAVESYIADVTSESKPDGKSSSPKCGNKLRDGTYIKYALTEKIQEASQQNGIFPHGSEQHQSYLAVAVAGNPVSMREALQRLQDELFHKSVNDAMMRIARQAALSAKAKIAEQAAQQQASAKGSLLATTRQLLLSRNGGGSSSSASASGSHDRAAGAAVGGGSLGVLTPTGASVHKHSRFSFGHEDTSAAAGGEAKSDEPKRRHSGSSEADVGHGGSAAMGASRTSSFGGTSSSGAAGSASSGGASGNGGLMRKFQDRFSSFSSSRHYSKTRVVSLRRMGQSGEDVRALEINMDAISGGLDEVKWKCARFLYDVEEVSHVAPAQIRILSYPGNQVLSSKSDRSALVKFLKPGAVWTIDIGASNNDMLNEW